MNTLLKRAWNSASSLTVVFIAAIALVLLCPPKVWASDASAQLQVSGITRTYSVHVPDGAPPPGGFPLILVFHGGGMQGAGMRRLTGLDAVADSRRFITVYPDGIDKHWNDGRSTIKNPQDDIGFVSALIDQLARRYPVSQDRVFAAGLSNGALFTERLGCELSGRIAGIAAVAGTMPSDLAPSCHPVRKVAVVQIDGTADPIMPFNGGAVADFGGRGEGGQVLSVDDTAAFWAQRNGCAGRGISQQMQPTVRMDRTRVLHTTFPGCAHGGPVLLLTVIGGGHAWPGGGQYAPRRMIGAASRQIDASQMIADFFLARR